jgi:hypothetical protein
MIFINNSEYLNWIFIFSLFWLNQCQGNREDVVILSELLQITATIPPKSDVLLMHYPRVVTLGYKNVTPKGLGRFRNLMYVFGRNNT